MRANLELTQAEIERIAKIVEAGINQKLVRNISFKIYENVLISEERVEKKVNNMIDDVNTQVRILIDAAMSRFRSDMQQMIKEEIKCQKGGYNNV